MIKQDFEKLLFLSVRFSSIFMPVIVASGMAMGGWASFSGFALVFGYYFIVEALLVATGLGVDASPEEEFRYVGPDRVSWFDEHGIKIYGIVQIVFVPAAAIWLAQPGRSTVELVGGLLSVCVMAGSVGGLTGHELIHRRKPVEKLLGAAVYGSVNYAHFTVSHLRGHHQKIALPEDWSSSRRNETSFHFLWRALVHGYLGAWRLDRSFMIGVTLYQVVFLSSLACLFGLRSLVILMGVSLLSCALMEMVNYLSHYGLTREKRDTGGYEPVSDYHSWESANKVTNWFIFNAGKHSHHHRRPFDPHHQLVLANDKIKLPYGLPLMTLIAFVPPLYFRIMNPRLELAEHGRQRRSA